MPNISNVDNICGGGLRQAASAEPQSPGYAPEPAPATPPTEEPGPAPVEPVDEEPVAEEDEPAYDPDE